MGKRGPKPKPTAILKAHGSHHANKRPDVNYENALTTLPACPDWVSKGGRAHWKTIGEIVLQMKLLAPEYVPALGLTVDAIAVYLSRAEEAEATAFTYWSESGPKEHPIHKAADRARMEMRRWIALWGLSPADVTSVTKPATQSGTVLSQFLHPAG